MKLTLPLLVLLLAGPAQAADVFLFSYFKGNGEDGLHLAWSRDGLRWAPLNGDRPFLKPAVGRDRLMRDPCLRRGPDGTFHLVWTTGWFDRIIGYASSRDLVHWSEQQAIPVMEHEPAARNAWAPEVFCDRRKKQWLIFWSTTIPGRFPETDKSGDDGLNHRVYYVTTKDFRTYSPAKLLFDGGFNVIDATLVEAGRRYALIVKDETKTPVKKNLRVVMGGTPEGPWGPAGEPFTISWVEGPSAIRIGQETVVYFDHYADPQYYGAMRSRDLKTWDDITQQVSFPPGVRHGTVLRVPDSVLGALGR